MTNNSEKISVGWFLYNPESKIVLLHKRDDKTPESPNKWDYFGGSGEEGETPIQALVRELGEELSISVEQDKIKPLRDFLIKDWHKYIFYILSNHKKEQMTLREGADFDWFSFDDALKLDLTDDARDNLLILKDKVLIDR